MVRTIGCKRGVFIRSERAMQRYMQGFLEGFLYCVQIARKYAFAFNMLEEKPSVKCAAFSGRSKNSGADGALSSLSCILACRLASIPVLAVASILL
eukprot:477275-Rhodomonas_salina.1